MQKRPVLWPQIILDNLSYMDTVALSNDRTTSVDRRATILLLCDI